MEPLLLTLVPIAPNHFSKAHAVTDTVRLSISILVNLAFKLFFSNVLLRDGQGEGSDVEGELGGGDCSARFRGGDGGEGRDVQWFQQSVRTVKSRRVRESVERGEEEEGGDARLGLPSLARSSRVVRLALRSPSAPRRRSIVLFLTRHPSVQHAPTRARDAPTPLSIRPNRSSSIPIPISPMLRVHRLRISMSIHLVRPLALDRINRRHPERMSRSG